MQHRGPFLHHPNLGRRLIGAIVKELLILSLDTSAYGTDLHYVRSAAESAYIPGLRACALTR